MTTSSLSGYLLARNIGIYFLLPGRFHGPVFIFPPDLDQLGNVQQVVQGVGAVPELMLPPEPQGYREEQEFVHIRAGYGEVAGASGGGFGPPPSKKPDRLQEITSTVSRRQETGSCSSSGQDQEDPCMTGW